MGCGSHLPDMGMCKMVFFHPPVGIVYPRVLSGTPAFRLRIVECWVALLEVECGLAMGIYITGV